ncbi:hypothetical protein F511_25740 [Dorcoceras hygrometricum]|uniref:Uncharacterized protein n=1 Tax=Dorcoceras hygrometricum TaxID=472368 RepID=A0A2Z7A6J5_9LAMI|nr:hypothetical protein F511_25740 [Dorcoceras hygrometricum]
MYSFGNCTDWSDLIVDQDYDEATTRESKPMFLGPHEISINKGLGGAFYLYQVVLTTPTQLPSPHAHPPPPVAVVSALRHRRATVDAPPSSPTIDAPPAIAVGIHSDHIAMNIPFAKSSLEAAAMLTWILVVGVLACIQLLRVISCWYFSCDDQQRDLRNSEATTFCEQEPVVGFVSVFCSG